MTLAVRVILAVVLLLVTTYAEDCGKPTHCPTSPPRRKSSKVPTAAPICTPPGTTYQPTNFNPPDSSPSLKTFYPISFRPSAVGPGVGAADGCGVGAADGSADGLNEIG